MAIKKYGRGQTFLKTILASVLLTFQFFTIVPVTKNIDLNHKTVTGMFQFLPWLGAFMGAVVALIFEGLQLTNSSSLLIGFLMAMAFIIWTGGLHLDGFTDMGDAYFSYQDVKKRQEILDDPRVGAFGAMALLFLVLTKIIFLTELVTQGILASYWLIFVPFLARTALGFYLVWTKPSKDKGIGFFFRTHIHLTQYLLFTVVSLLIGTALIMYWAHTWIPAVLVGITLIAVVFYKMWTKKNFGGASGDLYGAFIEGTEALLWITLLCLS